MSDDARNPDRGAVAVVVALVVTLVLLPVAALALDLGTMFTVTAALQRAADEAATAGATALAVAQRTTGPAAAIDAATAAAIEVLCNDTLLKPADVGWSTPCSDHSWTSAAAGTATGRYGFPGGQIQFYLGPAAADDHRFTAGQVYTGGNSRAVITGIRVVTPPVTIRYGFASLLGFSSGTAQRAATAELRTVLPVHDADGTAGGTGTNLPLYVTTHDGGAWCARSAPRASWRTVLGRESNHPTGTACDPTASPSVPRGYLASGELTQVLVPGSTIVTLQPQAWPQVARMRALTTVLFGSGGRLVRSGCPGGNTATTGGYSGVESGYLSDFVRTATGSAQALQSLILGGGTPTTAQQGWLSPDILRCGRLAVVPVLSTQAPPPLTGLTTTNYTVTGVRLLWLDNVFSASDSAPIAGTSTGTCLQRGFYWENALLAGYCPARDDTDAPLRAITGYVINPLLLPATVSGQDAANTTTYLGSGLPATVRLVHDISDPPGA